MQFLLLDFCEIGKYCIILSVVLDEDKQGGVGGMQHSSCSQWGSRQNFDWVLCPRNLTKNVIYTHIPFVFLLVLVHLK